MPYVVLDTNLFHGDPLMARRDFRIVLSGHLAGSYELVVPEVVLREIPKMYEHEYGIARDRMLSQAKTLHALGYEFAPPDLPAAGEARTSFVERFRSHLGLKSVTVAPIPQIDLSEFVDRAVAEKRPFQTGSRGFRDALIWESILVLAEEDDVILVTKNHSDFARSAKEPNELHEHLVEDLTSRGWELNRVTLCESLKTFIDTQAVEDQNRLDEVRAMLEEPLVAEELRNEVQSALSSGLSHWDQFTITTSQNAAPQDIWVQDVVVDMITPNSAIPTDDEWVTVELDVTGQIDAVFTVTAGEAEWIDHDDPDVSIDILEETFAQCSTGLRDVVATVSLDVNLERKELTNVERTQLSDVLS